MGIVSHATFLDRTLRDGSRQGISHEPCRQILRRVSAMAHARPSRISGVKGSERLSKIAVNEITETIL